MASQAAPHFRATATARKTFSAMKPPGGGSGNVTLSPVVEVDVDTTHGPSRGRTVADLRGVWAGYPPVKGARHRVVLEIEPGFEDRMIDLILTGDPAESPA